MAHQVPFHNPNAPYQPHPQQRQRPAFSQQPQQQAAADGFYSSGPPVGGAPAYGDQPAYHQSGQPLAPVQPQPQYGGASPSHPTYPDGMMGASNHPSSNNSMGGFFGEMGQAVNPELLNNPMAAYAMNHGAKMMEDQVKSFMPGAAAGALNMFGSVKYYFTVNNTYVVHRLKMLLCPFIHKDWRRIVQNEGNNTGVDVVYAPPSMDKNAPDLYIPLMSFVTYILIVGYIKGASGRFNPDVITEVSTYCCLMQLVEICLMKLGLYLLNSQINWLDLVSFTGYKYVALVINTVVHLILGYIPYYVVLAYTGIATSFFTLNGLKGTVPEPNHDQRRFRNYMLLAMAVLQLLLIWWNSYSSEIQ
ncbi:hypothetical protein H257_18848 [Aphanomyces astaci]|uniref:Protein YIF1 n=1 Tax=Aphanomyces astaci TaxID=112090 RepID=W4F9U6_APHAT|nr:hypothetical protein H257_18848 [Aphanomyces astaci]ETV64232.1 hypothetical protein H257_18848 [Aphanomyces astaci]|eukprot:XP_009846281.1 hypothetical protein H257_18848 [Aphanomyces astaci]